MKLSSRATKSVSEFTSRMKATVLSSDTLTRETPSAAVRPAFLAAFRPEDLRSSSIAASTLPSASTSAFLHSIMPRPVRSRSSLTIAAVIAAMFNPLVFSEFGGEVYPHKQAGIPYNSNVKPGCYSAAGAAPAASSLTSTNSSAPAPADWEASRQVSATAFT